MKRDNKVAAVLDQETSWMSTYLMIDRLLQLSATIDKLGQIGNSKLQLTSQQWRQAEELRDLLYQSYSLTKKLQMEEVTAGCFFRRWTGLGLRLEQREDSIMATEIVNSMKRREADLFENPIMLAAIYTDVLNMNLLSAGQKDIAQKALVELIIGMKGLANQEDQAGTAGKILALYCTYLVLLYLPTVG